MHPCRLLLPTSPASPRSSLRRAAHKTVHKMVPLLAAMAYCSVLGACRLRSLEETEGPARESLVVHLDQIGSTPVDLSNEPQSAESAPQPVGAPLTLVMGFGAPAPDPAPTPTNSEGAASLPLDVARPLDAMLHAGRVDWFGLAAEQGRAQLAFAAPDRFRALAAVPATIDIEQLAVAAWVRPHSVWSFRRAETVMASSLTSDPSPDAGLARQGELTVLALIQRDAHGSSTASVAAAVTSASSEGWALSAAVIPGAALAVESQATVLALGEDPWFETAGFARRWQEHHAQASESARESLEWARHELQARSPKLLAIMTPHDTAHWVASEAFAFQLEAEVPVPSAASPSVASDAGVQSRSRRATELQAPPSERAPDAGAPP